MGVRPWLPNKDCALSSLLQVGWYYLFFVMPGVNRKACMQRLLDDTQWPGPVWGMTLVFLSMMYIGSILCFIGMGLVYWANIPFLEQYRIRPEPWPWHGVEHASAAELENGADNTSGAAYINMVREVVKKYCSDLVVGVPVCGGLLFAFLSSLPAEEFEKAVLETPDWHVSALQIMAGLILFDTWFYFGHRLLHSPSLYARCHKRHHEFRTTMSMTGVWGTAEDGLLTMLLPGLLPIFLLKMHFWTSCMFTLIHYLQSVDDHCGYAFPFSPMRLIPFGGYPAEHNFHHSHCGGVPSRGNFALYFPFWDWLCGTNVAWLAYLEKNELDDCSLLPKKNATEHCLKAKES